MNNIINFLKIRRSTTAKTMISGHINESDSKTYVDAKKINSLPKKPTKDIFFRSQRESALWLQNNKIRNKSEETH